MTGSEKDNGSMKSHFTQRVMGIFTLYNTVGCLTSSAAQFGIGFGPSV